MKEKNLTLAFVVDATPEEVYAAVTNVRGWWSEGLVGASAAVGDELTYRHGDVHRSTHRVIEAVPGKRVVWKTIASKLSFDDPEEWNGTEVRFEIAPKGKKTELRFTHVGLTPELACFDSCTRGWTYYVGDSLRALVITGKGKPDPAKKATRAA